MRTLRSVLATAFAFACLASAAAARAPHARADTLVDLGNGDTVTGTFFPAAETEVFRFVAPAGARLTLIAQGKKKTGAKTPKVKLVLRDRTFNELTAQPGVLKPVPGGGKVSGLKLSLSGRYTATLTSGIAGDYTFQVKWTSPPKPAKEATDLGPGTTTDGVTFAADTGTKVTFTITADPGSTSLPRLVKVEATDLSWTSSTFALPSDAAAKSHTKRNVKLGGTGGDYNLSVVDTSPSPGPASVTFAVTPPPKVKPRKVNLTKQKTGSSSLNNFAKGAVVGTGGGSIVVEDPSLPSPLDGSGILIPSGALQTPTVVIISTGNTFNPPGDNGAQGPAVNFGPDGLQFKASADDVIVTIPFDPLPFGGDFSSLEIYVKNAQGKVSLVPKSKYEIDAAKGTVAFPVLHFSTYQAFGPKFKRKADLNDDGFDDLVVTGWKSAAPGFVHVFFGRADFATNQPAAPSLTITGTATDVSVGRDVAVGDVNGDGVADLALTVNDFAGVPHRAVVVFLGGSGFAPTSTANASVRFDGLGPFAETLGERLLIADVTGDGQGDLIAAAPSTTIDFAREGAVAIFRGGPAFTSATTNDPSTIVVKGGVDSLSIGVSLAAGRVAGADTAGDLVVGAEGGQVGGGPGNGNVFLIAGGPALVSGAVPTGTIRYVGEVVDDRFGTAVAVADVDGDGDDDLLAGAPGYDGDDPGDPRTDAGTVYVFRGPVFQGGPALFADVRLEQLLQNGEGRGAEIVTGNFGGGAIRDVAFSAPLRDGGSPSAPIPDTGGLFFLRGDPRFPIGFQFVTPGQSGTGYGTRILPAADLNGDGRDDLAVAAPDHDNGAGLIEVFFGQGAGQPTFRFIGGTEQRLGDR